MNEETQKKLDKLNKKYGAGTLITANYIEDVEVIPTGSLSLNLALGVGGIPVGKLIEISGMESSGKSTTTLHIIAEAQKLGKRVGILDAEHAFDREYAKALGVEVDSLLNINANNAEEGYNLLIDLFNEDIIDVAILDSHTALLPKSVIDSEVGTTGVAPAARINSTAVAKIKSILHYKKKTLIAISQIRNNIGGYGNPEKTTGGNAYIFYSDVRLKFSKQLDKVNEGNKTKVVVIKNKCASPQKIAEFFINWGSGIDEMREYIDQGLNFDLIKQGGAWYTFRESKFQGMDNLKQFLEDNPEVYEELKRDVLQNLKK